MKLKTLTVCHLAGCPYVTSVGATQLNGGRSEVAAQLSSGGFSNYFKTPSYQSAAVRSYIKGLGSEFAGRYNTSGRGIPDVSALGMNYIIEARGNATSDDGTSCSAPVFASVIAMLNDELIAAGKPTLGFLNPLLYSSKVSAAFNDIKSGE
jgi:tripeptidyl-peptidase I